MDDKELQSYIDSILAPKTRKGAYPSNRGNDSRRAKTIFNVLADGEMANSNNR